MTIAQLPPEIQDKFNDGRIKIKMICLSNTDLQPQIDRAVAEGWALVHLDSREGRSTAYMVIPVTTLNGE